MKKYYFILFLLLANQISLRGQDIIGSELFLKVKVSVYREDSFPKKFFLQSAQFLPVYNDLDSTFNITVFSLGNNSDTSFFIKCQDTFINRNFNRNKRLYAILSDIVYEIPKPVVEKMSIFSELNIFIKYSSKKKKTMISYRRLGHVLRSRRNFLLKNNTETRIKKLKLKKTRMITQIFELNNIVELNR